VLIGLRRIQNATDSSARQEHGDDSMPVLEKSLSKRSNRSRRLTRQPGLQSVELIKTPERTLDSINASGTGSALRRLFNSDRIILRSREQRTPASEQ